MTGPEFQAARAALGLSRERLAGRLGVTATTIYRWETGRQLVPVLAVLALRGLVQATDGKEAFRC